MVKQLCELVDRGAILADVVDVISGDAELGAVAIIGQKAHLSGRDARLVDGKDWT
jgi:hypothetical protein